MSRVEHEIESLAEKLGQTNLPEDEGVSFVGQGRSWSSAEDAQDVVDKINECSNMTFLNLEGNTLGVEAAEAIAKALETQSCMKKALWKDMFTGRMKNEIPIALKHLSRGLMKANAQLEVLDLSDNASGPIGAEGIVDLLKSPCCYTLKELKLNNMGLGITGAKMLAKALKECYDNSKATGKPLSLKVFIAGRNRLENEGAAALAAVFEEMGTLEEIQVPQNGIYYKGVQALSRAFAKNPYLREINLNDNTLTPEGSYVISEALSNLKNLVKLDLGDCLMKSQGAHYLAEALQSGHNNLQELIVSFNSINTEGGLALFDAVSKKQNFKNLNIDGNRFGGEGVELLKEAVNNAGKESTLASLSEDEGTESEGGSDEEESDPDYSESGSAGDESEDDYHKKENYDDNNYSDAEDKNDIIESGYSPHPKTGSAMEFLENPTEHNLDKLGDTAAQSIIQEVKSKKPETHLDELMKAIIKVSGLLDPAGSNDEKLISESWAVSVCAELYERLFAWGHEQQKISYINNTLPVYLGLIKDEETKKPLKGNRLHGCRLAVTYLMDQNTFPGSTKGTLKALLNISKN